MPLTAPALPIIVRPHGTCFAWCKLCLSSEHESGAVILLTKALCSQISGESVEDVMTLLQLHVDSVTLRGVEVPSASENHTSR